jgi:hypothetical protein
VITSSDGARQLWLLNARLFKPSETTGDHWLPAGLVQLGEMLAEVWQALDSIA